MGRDVLLKRGRLRESRSAARTRLHQPQAVRLSRPTPTSAVCWEVKAVHWVKRGDRANQPAVAARPNGSNQGPPQLPVLASSGLSTAGFAEVGTPSLAPFERTGLFSLADTDESVMPGFTSIEASRGEGRNREGNGRNGGGTIRIRLAAVTDSVVAKLIVAASGWNERIAWLGWEAQRWGTGTRHRLSLPVRCVDDSRTKQVLESFAQDGEKGVGEPDRMTNSSRESQSAGRPVGRTRVGWLKSSLAA